MEAVCQPSGERDSEVNRHAQLGSCRQRAEPSGLRVQRQASFRIEDRCRLWWEGPEWLKLPKDCWPVTDEIVETDSMQKAKKTVVIATTAQVEARPGVDNIVEAEKLSKFWRLVKVTAWVKRFVHNLRSVTTKGPKLTSNWLRVGE